VSKEFKKPTLEQVIEICNQYELGYLISIMEIFENTANVNMKILTNKGIYVIRIFSADLQRANAVLSVLMTLVNYDIPVLLPLKNTEGEYYSKFGSKTLQVTRFIQGQSFSFNKKQAYSSGSTLRKIHDALADIKCSISPKASIYPSTNVLKEGISKMERIRDKTTKDQIDLVIQLYDDIVEKWESKSSQLPKTIIHGDWHQGNQLYSESGDVCCIMDFDFITRAERLFDIAYSLWHFRIHKEGISMAKAFMEGYGYGKLINQEIELLPLEIARINYFFICTSALSLNPVYELNNQFNQQYPFLKWALSKDGKNTLNYLCQAN